jgi:DNA end-binding protein Ku
MWENRRMATSLWTGSISFGLVAIPVRMYSASRSHEVSFNQLHRATGNRIRYRKVDEVTGDEVTQREIVKGYEVTDGEYVTIDDSELAELRPAATKTLDIEDFVDLAEIDPIFFEKTYYVVPDDNLASRRAYGLLLDAMKERNRAGVGTVVIRSKQYLAAVRPLGDHLVVSTMKFADEVVDPADVPELEIDLPEIDAKARAMATSLIDSLTTEFEPTKFTDTYTDDLRALIETKARGETITPVERPASSPKVVDLMAALEASVAAAKAARTDGDSSAPAKPRKKRSSAA